MKVRTMNFVIWPVCILMTVLPLAVGLDYGYCDFGDGNYKYGTITSKVNLSSLRVWEFRLTFWGQGYLHVHLIFYFMLSGWSGALDSYDVLLLYSRISLAPHIGVILTILYQPLFTFKRSLGCPHYESRFRKIRLLVFLIQISPSSTMFNSNGMDIRILIVYICT